MKTLNDYLSLPYRLEIVPDLDEGGFVASYPDLPGCITCGHTIESVLANAIDAKKEWLNAALEDDMRSRIGWKITPVNLNYAFPKVCIVNWQNSQDEKASA